MSHTPSTRECGITKPDLRPCSSHRTRSQAPLYLYARCPIANRAEGTFALLRSACYSISLARITVKSNIKHLTSNIPPVRWLPPMLRNAGLSSGPGCSKAPRGLFVLSWVTRIFTGTSISPSPLSRQCSSRYSFRAGRNLPDKEFRYLRTVIVTAAVHRGFDSKLAPLLLTFRHWAGVSPYTSACAFSRDLCFW